MIQRQKKTVSGNLLELDYYPVTADGRSAPIRAPKSKPSTAEQQRYNKSNAAKKIVRLVNTNFDNTDFFLHLTYNVATAPQTEKDARRDIVNYIRRVKTKRTSEIKKISKRLNEIDNAISNIGDNQSALNVLIETKNSLTAKYKKLSQPLKYIYVIEKTEYKSKFLLGRFNWHFHLFISGGLDAKTVKDIWKVGERIKCDYYSPERFGAEAAAKYIAKGSEGVRKFSCSTNLKKPKVTCKDGKVSASTVKKMAKTRSEDKEYWERRYKGYKFVRAYARCNDYNGYWYLSVVMYKSDQDVPIWLSDMGGEFVV